MIMRHSSLILAIVLALGGCGGVTSVSSPPVNEIAILNSSFDQVLPSGGLAVWTASEHNQGNSYSFQADPEGAWSAPSSAKISRYGPEDYGMLSQQIRMQPAWLNKTVRLSAQLKVSGATGGGGALILQMNGASGDIISWNHMANARVTQTEGWKLYKIDLKVAPSTYSIKVGVMLEDSGTLWADDFKLEIID